MASESRFAGTYQRTFPDARDCRCSAALSDSGGGLVARLDGPGPELLCRISTEAHREDLDLGLWRPPTRRAQIDCTPIRSCPGGTGPPRIGPSHSGDYIDDRAFASRW